MADFIPEEKVAALTGAWIGVDLDGTLAVYTEWSGPCDIGEPIGPMVERVKGWLAEGKDVRIFTARVANVIDDDRVTDEIRTAVQQWCLEHIGKVLPVTCQKDYGLLELWDDRCVQIVPNTGLTLREYEGW
jgi:hypothetical protein